MAEALVSFLVEHLASLALERIEEEVRLVRGVDEDVASLKTNLEDIRTVLEDAEQKQLADRAPAGLRIWLEKLKSAYHDMDDVLDEWNYDVLEHRIRKEEEAIDKKLNGELDRIAKEKNRYNLVSLERVIELPRLPQSTYLVEETTILGRQKEKSVLISKLCESSGDEGESYAIVPIVGMGGLGKTTLAQLAYNDRTVKTHFDKQIWVCVSDPFNEVNIAKAIVEGLTGEVNSSTNLNTLVESICNSIKGNRFLLVLDDVWLEDYNRWETFKVALKRGAKGSRIIVTTRKEEVAMMMEANKNKVAPQKLSEEDCWSIFRQLAFAERTTEEREELQNIGWQIALKSKGLPLVAKALGSLMRLKKSKSQWEDILSSELWESKDDKVREIFAPFLLSYYDLTPLERLCFLYCSMFPKDFDIKRDVLIEMWMSQGYLGAQTMNSRRKGRDCFETLVMRSFLQDVKEDSYHRDIVCKMHDIVHDFAQYLAGHEYVSREVLGNQMELVDKSSRHLTIVLGSSSPELPVLKDNAESLRTLYLESHNYFDQRGFTFSHLIRLRALNLSRYGLKGLSKDIDKLIHIRYLDLSENFNLEELPDALFTLYNLQTLRLRRCYSLRRIPEGIRKLVNLRNLYISECGIDGLPKGIVKITGIQTLDSLVVPKDRDAYFDLGDLKMLKCLQFQEGSLEMSRCANVGNLDEAKKIGLETREHLVALKLSFTKEYQEMKQIQDESGQKTGVIDEVGILEGLQPHCNLKSLEISNYMGSTVSPRWMMSMINLRILRLCQCISCEVLPPLGKLPSLESLAIEFMRSLKKVGPEFLGISDHREQEDCEVQSELPIILFPKLKQLRFRVNWDWRKWEECATTTTNGHHLTIMPCLHSLEIDSCLWITELPDFLRMTPLQNLSISECFLLEKNCLKTGGKEWLKIFHVPNIQLSRLYVKRDGTWIHQRDNLEQGNSSAV